MAQAGGVGHTGTGSARSMTPLPLFHIFTPVSFIQFYSYLFIFTISVLLNYTDSITVTSPGCEFTEASLGDVIAHVHRFI